MMFLTVVSLIFALYISRWKYVEQVVVLVISLWLSYESLLGIRQLFGLSSSHHCMFVLTGSFANPGPYGGFIAICAVIAFSGVCKYHNSEKLQDRLFVLLSGISGGLGVIVLPASMSRAAWVAFFMAGAILSYMYTPIRTYLKSHKWIVLSALVVIILVTIGAFNLKEDSALGRFHIWEMELRAIADKPLTGHGYGHALGAYGDAQAHFFQISERSVSRQSIAGCPEYAFNEYLRYAMDFGIPGLLLFLIIMGLSVSNLYREQSILTCGLIAWGVFAFASYPMDVWQLRLLLAVFIGAAFGGRLVVPNRWKMVMVFSCLILAVVSIAFWIPDYERKEEAKYRWHEEQRYAGFGNANDVADSLALSYPQLKTDFRYLYDYGYALHKEGRFLESNIILHEGTLISSDPMFYNIIGKNYESIGDYKVAEKYYMHAHYMVPSRLYPFILLMDMYDHLGDTSRALEYSKKALALPVNEKNMAMRKLRDRAEVYFLTYKNM